MASDDAIREEVSVDEQGLERADDTDDEAALRPTVGMLTDAKVDANAPEAKGLTLAAEERMQAREAEIARTRERAESNPDTTRERAARACSREWARQARAAFAERRAALNRWAAPDAPDPRETLSRDEVAAVNEQAARIADEIERGASRASIARRVARRVADGQDVLAAALAVRDDERAEPGRVVDIADIGAVDSEAVTIEGRIETLWENSHPAIQDVGLIADETGRTKVTVWVRSQKQPLREGERVRLTNVSKSWHDGRVSVAVTGWSRIDRLDDEA